ncbi:MAG: M56 family metallopeptidase [Candidatus Marinimicrobia bacterium]|nr:M56 family metallopeptidase [Candidatus Neomarinimicrobiota bacterium]
MMNLWTAFSATAPGVMQTLLQAEMQLAAMGIMVLLLDRYLVRVDQNFRYILWLTVLAKALWPPMLYIPALDVWPAEMLTIGLAAPGATTGTVDAAGTLSGNLTAPAVLAVIWAGLSALLLLTIILQSWSLRVRLATGSRPGEAEMDKLFPGQVWPPVSVSDSITSPMTVGLLRPRIYLTPQVISGSRAHLKAILFHEKAHVLRHDNWAVLLVGLAVILHPFNPLVWIMGHRLSRYREQACDAYAVEQAAIDPQIYGHMLIDQITPKSQFLPSWQTATCFSESKVDLRQRLGSLMLLKEPIMKYSTVILRTLLGATVFVMVLLSSQCQEGDSDEILMSIWSDEGELETVVNADGSITLTDGNETLIFKGSILTLPDGQKVTLADGDIFPLSNGRYLKLSGGKVHIMRRDAPKFVPYDTAPVPIGGFQAIRNALIYPKAAMESGIEGVVTVQIFINETGQVTETMILRGVPDSGLDDAAMAAIEGVTFTPAQHEGQDVGVWIAVPIRFKLPVE